MGSKQAPQIDRVRDDEGTRIRAYPRAHRLEGAPHVVFKSWRGQLVGGIPSRESFRALGPQRTGPSPT
jgi:3-deoxy-D-arabino-heptulosonate 7-phosphate (DAHP) synthase class II